MCLSYIVGDLENIPDDNTHFYGKNSVVNEDLGIKILNCLLILGVDPYEKNCYGENVFQSLASSNSLTKRKNNENFKSRVNNLQRCSSP